MLNALRTTWLSNVRGDLLAGIVVALALIPEAIAFSIVAGIDPRVGLYASFCIAVVIAFCGWPPRHDLRGDRAMALLMVSLVREHGLEYLLAATLLTGVFQIIAGQLRLANLMRFVSRSVVTGFVNALAILIFMAQIPELTNVTWHVYAMTARRPGHHLPFPADPPCGPYPAIATGMRRDPDRRRHADGPGHPDRGRYGRTPGHAAGIPVARGPADPGNTDHHPALRNSPDGGRPAGIHDDRHHRG